MKAIACEEFLTRGALAGGFARQFHGATGRCGVLLEGPDRPDQASLAGQRGVPALSRVRSAGMSRRPSAVVQCRREPMNSNTFCEAGHMSVN